jgi:hypothetical protein
VWIVGRLPSSHFFSKKHRWSVRCYRFLGQLFQLIGAVINPLLGTQTKLINDELRGWLPGRLLVWRDRPIGGNTEVARAALIEP